MSSSTTAGTDGSTKQPERKLPPGMVLGPDGKPCKVCTAFRNWKPTNVTPTKDETGNISSFGVGASSALAFMPNLSTDNRQHCPPDSEEIGRATWAFLHTTAAYFPDRPTPTQRANMLMLIKALPVLYPCSSCAQDFGESVKVHPPDVSSREKLSSWLCERHNEVNKKLGKELFDCGKTDERWKDGTSDGRCV